MSTFLTERENIRIEEMCDAVRLALEEGERDEVVFEVTQAYDVCVLDEVRDRARAAGYLAEVSGRTLTVRKKEPS